MFELNTIGWFLIMLGLCNSLASATFICYQRVKFKENKYYIPRNLYQILSPYTIQASVIIVGIGSGIVGSHWLWGILGFAVSTLLSILLSAVIMYVYEKT